MLDRRAWGRAARLLSWIGVFAAVLCTSRAASAYPWMIRHQYQGCVPCHADPSGAGLLTEYGRAMGENILRTRYGVPPPDEPSKVARFLWGVPTPDWLLLGGSVRNGVQLTKSSANPWDKPRLLQMEADLKAQLTFSRFRAYGSLGYMHEGAQLTQLTHSKTGFDTLVSREHWIGVDLGEDKQFLLRAGRIDLPFGIRNDEHDLLVRSTATTRTNLNESQQHGVAFNYNGAVVRGEIMALLGNYQLNPDVFRERGYAGYLEVLVAQSMAVGASSLVLRQAGLPGQPHARHDPSGSRRLRAPRAGSAARAHDRGRRPHHQDGPKRSGNGGHHGRVRRAGAGRRRARAGRSPRGLGRDHGPHRRGD